jgi:hypothetical protein
MTRGFVLLGLWPFPRNHHTNFPAWLHDLIAFQERVCPEVAVIDTQRIRQPITARLER